jgi:hypothetical protein
MTLVNFIIMRMPQLERRMRFWRDQERFIMVNGETIYYGESRDEKRLPRNFFHYIPVTRLSKSPSRGYSSTGHKNWRHNGPVVHAAGIFLRSQSRRADQVDSDHMSQCLGEDSFVPERSGDFLRLANKGGEWVENISKRLDRRWVPW